MTLAGHQRMWMPGHAGTDEGEEVILMFSIPEDFPEELLPLDVLISADHLDAILLRACV